MPRGDVHISIRRIDYFSLSYGPFELLHILDTFHVQVISPHLSTSRDTRTISAKSRLIHFHRALDTDFPASQSVCELFLSNLWLETLWEDQYQKP